MNRRCYCLSFLLLACALIESAHAQSLVQMVDRDWTLSTHTIAVGENLKAVTVSVTNASDFRPDRVNSISTDSTDPFGVPDFEGIPPGFGVGGEWLHQHHFPEVGLFATPLAYDYIDRGLAPSPLDSHLLPPVSISIFDPTEGEIVTPTAETGLTVGGVTGFGDGLDAGVTGFARDFWDVETLDLAYLVVDQDLDALPVNFEMADGDATTQNVVFRGLLPLPSVDLPPLIDGAALESIDSGEPAAEVAFQFEPGGTPAESWEISQVLHTADFGGDGSGAAQQATIDSEGQFSWNPTGSSYGRYEFGITVSNAIGLDVAVITIHYHPVPEPSAVTLVALLATTLGLGRRSRPVAAAWPNS